MTMVRVIKQTSIANIIIFWNIIINPKLSIEPDNNTSSILVTSLYSYKSKPSYNGIILYF